MKPSVPAPRTAAPVKSPEDHGNHASLQPLQYQIEDSRRQAVQSQQLVKPQSNSMHYNPHGLPPRLRAGIEALSGMNVSDVVVHRNSSRPAQLSAAAYTQGSEIHLGPSQEQYLPHEAWHVVQQWQGRVAPTTRMNGVHINDDDCLEHE